jgi:hypothetical protein
MFSSDGPFVAYVLKFKYLINCTKIVRDKNHTFNTTVDLQQIIQHYTKNEEKLRKYIIKLKSPKTLSDQSV